MHYKFEDYKIQIADSNNYPDKYVVYIEEFFSVIEIINSKDDAVIALRPLYDMEIDRLKNNGLTIPEPGSGKAKVTFAKNDKIEKLRPFIDSFCFKFRNIIC